ncbi:winged helix-turn-helix transcriptional regulator [Microbacterium hominis]|uniref:MarR family winged helix-turn-helix transcriptional regulator n=1 Tax=Microbacterium hominis TaxID=162426 RepID=UPI00196538B1|nr:MarR family winged helix-turn-helix transcriptional regulator [Microbacterium hominis]QRY41414.1 winged helix-turn-helix transcriptional regulator [Microbacterium hominis]
MESVDEEQVQLLTYVRLSPGIAVSKLARLVRATPAVTRRHVEALEARGLLERRNHPDHPDANELHVTAAGVAALGAEA